MTQNQPHAISTIESVPDEILHEIFMQIALDYYPKHNGCWSPTVWGDHPLLSVVQVNKRFNAVASPILGICWRLKPTDQSGAKFVLHLLKNPYLRSQVKSLIVGVPLYKRVRRVAGPLSPVKHTWPRSLYSTTIVEQLVQSAATAYPPLAAWRHDDGEYSWRGQIEQRSISAITTLAVAWATELRELDLTLDYWDSEDPEMSILRLVKMVVGVLWPPAGQDRGSVPSSVVLNKLRCVTLRHYNHDGFFHGSVAAAFFRLPGLRVFKAYSMEAAGLMLDEVDPSGSGTALQPLTDQLFPNGTSHVEEIHLHSRQITDTGIRVLARACRRLRILILEWSKSMNVNEDSEVSSEAIADAISLHSTSLEEICISYESGTNSWLDPRNPGISGDYLLRCHRLERLTIDLTILYGLEDYEENSAIHPLSEILPPSLTSLTLSGGSFSDEDAEEDPMDELVRNTREYHVTKGNIMGLLRECGPNERFSKLKELDLVNCWFDVIRDQDIKALAPKKGVKLVR